MHFDHEINSEQPTPRPNNCKTFLMYDKNLKNCSKVYASILTCPKQYAWSLPRVTRKVRLSNIPKLQAGNIKSFFINSSGCSFGVCSFSKVYSSQSALAKSWRFGIWKSSRKKFGVEKWLQLSKLRWKIELNHDIALWTFHNHLSTLLGLMAVQVHDTTEYFTERIVLMVLPRREFSNFCIRFLLCHIL